MIPRVQTGGSFTGAGLYYLHDKGEIGAAERPTSSARVAWTHALNTVHDEPEAALEEMRWTCWDQQWLKAQAGHNLSGKPSRKPVMTIALAWSPDQTPTRAQMIEVGKSYLEHMGWQEHQALFVAHNDTAHPHLHIILNRVHPETGMTLDDGWRKNRAHEWSHAQEQAGGKIYCKAREGRYDHDADAAPRKGKRKGGRDSQGYQPGARRWGREADEPIIVDSVPAQADDAQEWEGLRENQKAARLAFVEESKQRGSALRRAIREEVKQEFTPQWQAYQKYKAEKMEAAKLYDREAQRAIKHYARLYGLKDGKAVLHKTETGEVRRAYSGAANAKIIKDIKARQKDYHARLKADLKAQREGIFERQKARIEERAAPAFKIHHDERSAAYERLKASHREEKTERRHDQDVAARQLEPSPATPAAAQRPEPIARATGPLDQPRHAAQHAQRRDEAQRQHPMPVEGTSDRRAVTVPREIAGGHAATAKVEQTDQKSRAMSRAERAAKVDAWFDKRGRETGAEKGSEKGGGLDI